MARPRLYLDEDVHGGVARGLRRRGYVLCRQVPVGTVVRHVAALLAQHGADDLMDQLVWLKVPG